MTRRRFIIAASGSTRWCGVIPAHCFSRRAAIIITSGPTRGRLVRRQRRMMMHDCWSGRSLYPRRMTPQPLQRIFVRRDMTSLIPMAHGLPQIHGGLLFGLRLRHMELRKLRDGSTETQKARGSRSSLALFVFLCFGSAVSAQAQSPNWRAAVDSALGRPGALQPDSAYKFGFPRSDLSVSIGDVKLRPALALGSW